MTDYSQFDTTVRICWGRVLVVLVLLVGWFVGVTAFMGGCAPAEASEVPNYEGQRLSVPVMTLIAEAGGEKDRIKAMQAVGNVIRRRAELRGLTVEAVCLQPYQFSCWNDKARLMAFIRKNRAVYEDALTAWQLSGVEDVTGGADHYFADYIKTPKWAKNMVQTAVVGRHRFYKS